MKKNIAEKEFDPEKYRKWTIFVWAPICMLAGAASLWISYRKGQNDIFSLSLLLGILASLLLLYFVTKNWKRRLTKREAKKSREWASSPGFRRTVIFSVAVIILVNNFLKMSLSLEIFLMSFLGTLFLICSPMVILMAIFKKGIYQQ